MFLFATLQAMGLPAFYVNAIPALHKENLHSLRISGDVLAGFCVTAGVRQGCQFSGILFAIATNVLLKAMKRAYVTSRFTIRAYADDIGLAL